MYQARILGPESENWGEMIVPSKVTFLEFVYFAPNVLEGKKAFEEGDLEIPLKKYIARLERVIPPEDGGPLLIYRIGAKDVLVD